LTLMSKMWKSIYMNITTIDVGSDEKLQSMDVRSLLAVYDRQKILGIRKLDFTGVDGKDVYNITAPFRSSEHEYIAGRVESREKELESQVMFFIRKNNKWVLDENAPVLNLQDPLISIINDEFIIGGVEIVLEQDMIDYSTVFLRGKDVYHLERFTQGPRGMKDIRLTLLPQGSVGLFTRPQGAIGGNGRIGFMNIASLESLLQLKYEDYFAAPLLSGSFKDEEWLGVNAAYTLKNGLVGVVGHIACHTEDAQEKLHKNYYPVTFALHPQTNTPVGMKIIATRDDFPPGQSKVETLRNVLFVGGLVRHDDGAATMYVGAGDAESYEVRIVDPFLEYELGE
jgi:hypothetical protein